MKTRRNFTIVFCVSLLLALAVRPVTSHTQEEQLAAPVNIVAWYSGKYIQLNWDADPATATLGYNVYRSVGSTVDWQKLTESPFELSSFVDYAPPLSETVYYKVTAVSKEGVEGQDSYALPVQTFPTPEKPSAGSEMSAAAYSKDNIITDQQLTDSGAMSLSQIQAFLSSQGSVLANYSTGGKSAAQHIYEACQTHGINPQVVLVTLQKEKGLIKSSTANPENLAMGWNTGDASTSGFADQIYWGTRQFKLYYNNLGGYRDRLGNPWAVGQPREVSDGTVTGANIATPGLYIYTPWIGQGGGGRAGIGGNYLFWDLWANTFVFDSEVVLAVTQPEFKLPLPAGKDWLLSVETGKPTSQCGGGIGGRFYGGGFDCFHTGTSKYALDFIDNNRQDGELTGRADVDILAAAPGTVENVITSTAGFGNHVIINHGGGYTTIYGHLKSNSFTVARGQAVAAGAKIGVMGTTGNSTGIHIHFEVRLNGQGAAESATLDQVILDGRRMIDYLVGTTTAPTYYRSNNTGCGNGSSESFRVNAGPPVHPNGTVVKVSGNNTVYLIWNGQKRGITSESWLQSLYDQPNSNFSSSVITVAADELSKYPEGPVISGRLPGNGRGQPDGRLIRQTGGGEISIVTNNGRRRPFASESAFLGLGYLYCNVVEVSDYSSYPAEAVADGTSPLPTITSGPTFSPSGPTVGQTLNGNFIITNRGNASITFSALTIGGRLNDSLIRDFPLQTNIVLSPNQSWTYQGSLNLSEAGTYKFFPAYRTPDGIWKVALTNEIGTSTGGSATVVFNVTAACPTVNQATQPSSGNVGSSVVIGGSNLNGVTGVRFSGGVAAGFTINSNSQITANVPSGAVSGPITVSKSGCSDAQTGTFTVTVSPPPPPSLNQPTNVTPNSATLSWSGVSDATQYRVQVSTSSTFNTGPDGRDCFNCLPNGNQVIDAPATSYNLTGLSTGTTYFWRVRAGRFATTSEWTTDWPPVASFSTTQGTIPVTVGTNPSGRSFTVDGTTYTATKNFDWLPGSSHTIGTVATQDGAPGTRYVWGNWSDGQAMSHTVSPTVATTYTANFTTQHFLTMNTSSGGTVAPASGWFNAGQGISVSATPNSGFSFGGWTGSGLGSFSGASNPATVTMNGPVTQTGGFTQNGIQVVVQTNPAGRSFTVDGNTFTSAQSFTWIPGSTHTIGTASTQAGAAGTQYVWSGWSDGGAISHGVAPTGNAVFTANFVTQHFLTMNAGTGGTVSPSSGWFNGGQSVTINASPASGFNFGGWSGSGPGSFTGASNPAAVTMNGPITQTGSFVSAPPALPNIALNKPATQSSDGYGGLPSLAVDGNTNGTFGAGSVTHTLLDAQAWWQVDLGSVSQIQSIQVWNRAENADRLANFYVFVSDVPFTSTSLTTTLNQAGVSNYHTAGQGGRPTQIPIGRAGRYVRVQLAGTNYLSLAEVEVFGTGTQPPLTNLALAKSPAQSSTGFGGAAGRAADGNTSGNWNDGSVAHTNADAQAWWQVDLGSVGNIDNVKVWNRTDCCGDRLSNFYVLVSDNPFPSTDLTTARNQTGVFSYLTAGQAGTPTTIPVSRTGRYVRVQLAGTNYLALAEVEVWGSSGGGGTPATPFITTTNVGTLRNNYTGWVGMKFTVGAQALTVRELGRYVVAGNTGTHTVKIVRVSDNVQVATAGVATSGAPTGQYKYAALASPVTLSANTAYYLVSEEASGGDQWYDSNTTVVVTAAGTINAATWSDLISWYFTGGAGNTFVPANFKYE